MSNYVLSKEEKEGGVRLFKELDKQYPNSKFILNTRYKNDWIRSRIKHGDYLFQISRRLRIHYNYVIKLWKDEWDTHHINVKKYFKHRPNDLLIYHINKDKPEKIKDFFKDIYELDITHWKHYGKSK